MKESSNWTMPLNSEQCAHDHRRRKFVLVKRAQICLGGRDIKQKFDWIYQ